MIRDGRGQTEGDEHTDDSDQNKAIADGKPHANQDHDQERRDQEREQRLGTVGRYESDCRERERPQNSTQGEARPSGMGNRL